MPPLLWAGPSVWRLSPAESPAVAAGKGSWFRQRGGAVQYSLMYLPGLCNYCVINMYIIHVVLMPY
jgi:hypothetical protein